MARKAGTGRILAVGLLLAAFLIPVSAHAIEVKKQLPTGGGGGGGGGPVMASPSMHNPLTSAQQKALQDAVASDSDQFVGEESEKKAGGQIYMDLDHAAFSYIPSNKGGVTTVVAKLTASEYRPKKGDPEARGSATGNKKALVFNYKAEGNKMVATEPPKWEDVASAAAKKK